MANEKGSKIKMTDEDANILRHYADGAIPKTTIKTEDPSKLVKFIKDNEPQDPALFDHLKTLNDEGKLRDVLSAEDLQRRYSENFEEFDDDTEAPAEESEELVPAEDEPDGDLPTTDDHEYPRITKRGPIDKSVAGDMKQEDREKTAVPPLPGRPEKVENLDIDEAFDIIKEEEAEKEKEVEQAIKEIEAPADGIDKVVDEAQAEKEKERVEKYMAEIDQEYRVGDPSRERVLGEDDVDSSFWEVAKADGIVYRKIYGDALAQELAEHQKKLNEEIKEHEKLVALEKAKKEQEQKAAELAGKLTKQEQTHKAVTDMLENELEGKKAELELQKRAGNFYVNGHPIPAKFEEGKEYQLPDGRLVVVVPAARFGDLSTQFGITKEVVEKKYNQIAVSEDQKKILMNYFDGKVEDKEMKEYFNAVMEIMGDESKTINDLSKLHAGEDIFPAVTTVVKMIETVKGIMKAENEGFYKLPQIENDVSNVYFEIVKLERLEEKEYQEEDKESFFEKFKNMRGKHVAEKLRELVNSSFDPEWGVNEEEIDHAINVLHVDIRALIKGRHEKAEKLTNGQKKKIDEAAFDRWKNDDKYKEKELNEVKSEVREEFYQANEKKSLTPIEHKMLDEFRTIRDMLVKIKESKYTFDIDPVVNKLRTVVDYETLNCSVPSILEDSVTKARKAVGKGKKVDAVALVYMPKHTEEGEMYGVELSDPCMVLTDSEGTYETESYLTGEYKDDNENSIYALVRAEKTIKVAGIEAPPAPKRPVVSPVPKARAKMVKKVKRVKGE